MCRRMRTRVVREGARDRAFIGEEDGKVGRNEKESGGGSEEDGVIVGRKGNQWKYEGGEDGGERKKPNRKSLHAVQKGECGGKSGKYSSKNRSKSDPKRGKTRKKWASQGKKRARSLEKSPEIGFETGKGGKNGDFGAKKEGWGGGEKWALLPILQCYEVAKWAQMKFSRIFFRRSLAGNAEMPYLCTRNREATLLQERVTL